MKSEADIRLIDDVLAESKFRCRVDMCTNGQHIKIEPRIYVLFAFEFDDKGKSLR